jgi:two-component system chemotaxis response regulator CheB
MSLIHVLVVDDSVVVRRFLSEVLGADPELVVIGAAATGRIALAKIPQVAPDVVVLDLEMPELDGLATLRQIRLLYPTLPVVMFGSITDNSAGVSLEALAMGPTDFVAKPAGVASLHRGVEEVCEELITKIKGLCARLRATKQRPARLVPDPAAVSRIRPPAPRPESSSIAILAIGASTGGPDALAELLPVLPGDFPLPVVVVQHMPPVFTTRFARRLDAACALQVREAQVGDLVVPGRVLLAPGDYHMRLRRDGDDVRVSLDQGAPESFCRPAVDPMLRSVAEVYGGAVLAVILTGMGHDGARGCEQLRRLGATILAQDERTSVVWGMPGAVAGAGLAHRVLPLERIGREIVHVVRGRTGTATPVSAS